MTQGGERRHDLQQQQGKEREGGKVRAAPNRGSALDRRGGPAGLADGRSVIDPQLPIKVLSTTQRQRPRSRSSASWAQCRCSGVSTSPVPGARDTTGRTTQCLVARGATE